MGKCLKEQTASVLLPKGARIFHLTLDETMKEARTTPRNRHILWRFFAQLQQAEDDPEAVDKDLDKAPGK